MIQQPSQFLNISVQKQHTEKPVVQHSNESEADQARLQYGAPRDNNKRLETFNYYHKVLHTRGLSSPISNSVSMNYVVSKYAIKTAKWRKSTEPSLCFNPLIYNISKMVLLSTLLHNVIVVFLNKMLQFLKTENNLSKK